MFDQKLAHYRTFDSSPMIDDAIDVFRCELQPDCLRADERIESSAISHVKLDGADSLHVNMLIAQVKKRRNISKRRFYDFAAGNRSTCANSAGGHVESYIVLIDELRFNDEFCERDDRVPAHHAVAFVVQKENIEIGVRG